MHEYRVTMVDLYGFGATPHPENPLTLDDYAQAIIDIIRYYKMSYVVLVGHSFGGKVALRTARKYGQFIEKLVLIDASGIKPRRTISYYAAVMRYKILKKLGKPAANCGSADYNAAKGYMRATFVKVVNTHLDKELPCITLPTLIIWGSSDTETPLYMGRKLARRLCNAKLVVLKGAGHFSYIDKYALCLAHIKGFIGGLNG